MWLCAFCEGYTISDRTAKRRMTNRCLWIGKLDYRRCEDDTMRGYGEENVLFLLLVIPAFVILADGLAFCHIHVGAEFLYARTAGEL